MKNIKSILSFLIVVVSMSSCVTIMPYAVTDHPIGEKKGVSKTSVILGVIELNKEYSIAEAAKKGKIKGPISTVDLKITSYLGPFFYTKELLVTGDAE